MAAAATSDRTSCHGAARAPPAGMELAEIIGRLNEIERSRRGPKVWDRWNVIAFVKAFGVSPRGEPGCKRFIIARDMMESGLWDALETARQLARIATGGEPQP